MAEIILPPVPPRPTPAIRPTMSPELETPGNKGVKVIMVQGPGTQPGPQPDPGPDIETDEITVLTYPEWDPNNIYKEGETIRCTTAVFEGGLPPFERCNWRWQATIGGDLIKSERIEYGNKAITVSDVVPEGCTDIVMQCNAADDLDGDPDVDSLTKKNAFSSLETIEQPYEPLSISRGAQWDDSNIYEVGQIIEARTAVFAGGKEPVTYKYRFQTKEWVDGTWSDTDWVSGPWMETTNEAKACQWVGMLEETIRFQSWAEDSSDPVNTVPSYTLNKSICEIGTVSAIVNGVFYDLAAASTITVESLSVNALTIEITGLARVSYNWSVRGNAGVEFSDPTEASTDLTIATAGVVTVQCAIQSEGELKTVDIQFFVV